MAIARDEVFGPALCVLSYRDDDEVIALATDSHYVAPDSLIRAVAARLQAGTVMIRIRHELLAPFGGAKQSGLSRGFGVFGLASYLELGAVIEA